MTFPKPQLKASDATSSKAYRGWITVPVLNPGADRGFLKGSQDISNGTNVANRDGQISSVFTSLVYGLHKL
jgi:hypothetical protein